MARWMSLHLNGWKDEAARDWDVEDQEVRLDAPQLIDGGMRPVVVAFPPPPQSAMPNLDEWLVREGRWLGGPQAALSPIGRGIGWGDIGDHRLRLSLSKVIEQLQLGPDAVAARAFEAAARALSQGAERTVVAVPDLASFAEAAQGRFLKALKVPRGPNPLLIWRSVAMFLGLLRHGKINANDVGHRIRLLIHDSNGIEVQDFVLTETLEYSGHLAPQRSGFGRLIMPEIGLERLVFIANQKLFAQDPRLASRIEASQLADLELFGGIVLKPEVLRLAQGNWHQNQNLVPSIDLPEISQPARMEPSQKTFFATPLADPVAGALLAKLNTWWPSLQTSAWSDIAFGALHAGRLIEKGLPHYYDRLEPISLAVMTSAAAEFLPLIEDGRSVPANKEFISRPMTGFSWSAGKEAIDFYVLKGDTEVRTWRAKSDIPPIRSEDVHLQLRQTPGQSWARLEASSPTWDTLSRNPVYLDWETLQVDPRTPEEILETLRRPDPTFPRRIVEAADRDFWSGVLSPPGFHEIDTADEDALYGFLQQSSRMKLQTGTLFRAGPKIHPISTDGDLPKDLSAHEESRIVAALDDAWLRLRNLESAGRLATSNRPFLILTWSFARCPLELQSKIVEALEDYNRHRKHPLHDMPTAKKILQQGAGRTVAEPRLFARLLRALGERQVHTTDTHAALSFCLTRRSEIALAMNDSTVSLLAKRLCEGLKTLVTTRSFQIHFRHVLNAIAGLLRYRESKPRALLVDNDNNAAEIHRQLQRALKYLPHSIARDKALVGIVIDLMALLEGTGGDPDILVKIDQLD